MLRLKRNIQNRTKKIDGILKIESVENGLKFYGKGYSTIRTLQRLKDNKARIYIMTAEEVEKRKKDEEQKQEDYNDRINKIIENLPSIF